LPGSELHRRLYRRLLEFDDVRPQSALLDFILAREGLGGRSEEAWALLQPVAVRLLELVASDPFVVGWRGPVILKTIRAVLGSRRATFPMFLARHVAGRALAVRREPETLAAREPSIIAGKVRFVVAGHTHQPRVVHLQHRPDTARPLEQYYVDTGTWRNRLLAARDCRSFGRLKALSYVVVYSSTEDPEERIGASAKRESFDYWSGYSQRWLS
jgi:hypothetical protein